MPADATIEEAPEVTDEVVAESEEVVDETPELDIE